MIGFRKVWGGFEGVWACFGGSRWVKGGLLDPYRALFAPLEVLFGTRFGSKHHIMAQLPNGDTVGITDPFLDLLGQCRPVINPDFLASSETAKV